MSTPQRVARAAAKVAAAHAVLEAEMAALRAEGASYANIAGALALHAGDYRVPGTAPGVMKALARQEADRG